jgi:hypothetical protein
MGFKMGNYGLGFFLQITSCHVFCRKEDYQVSIYISNVMGYHYEKKRCFATSLATQFLSWKGDLQLIVFICREC